MPKAPEGSQERTNSSQVRIHATAPMGMCRRVPCSSLSAAGRGSGVCNRLVPAIGPAPVVSSTNARRQDSRNSRPSETADEVKGVKSVAITQNHSRPVRGSRRPLIHDRDRGPSVLPIYRRADSYCMSPGDP